MRVSEQIDALESLSFDPVSFLILPRILAAAVMFPILVIIADFFGIVGGLFAAVNAMDVSYLEFIRGLRNWFRPFDAWFGLIKGLFFGVAITSIACYQGYYTTGGATGVGRATTATVVISCVSIVFLDYILAAILLR
jgi:phospholipid/cholesterol/gamma-HCH transport system permease protein